ncbi:3066_t:CDS:1 [Ambispora gerdemannii]|uniref:3066_t:CDS:1 n=1 Tax=Ambispora gerdemannii TaxID=144530 RepID=A0A9N9D4K4_9GLOM|nr:3066_t:CDS:1 [Ambispora gerdemannii]
MHNLDQGSQQIFDSNLIQVIECEDYSLLLIKHPNIGTFTTRIFSINEFIEHLHQNKTPNCFLLFRMIFSKAIKESGIKLERRYISEMAGSCWKSSSQTRRLFKNIYNQLKQLLPEQPHQTNYNSTAVVNSIAAYPDIFCFGNSNLNNSNNYADELNYLPYQNQNTLEQPHQANYDLTPVVNSMVTYPDLLILNNNNIYAADEFSELKEFTELNKEDVIRHK